VTWNVVVSRPARQDLRRLDRQTAQRVVAAIERLAETDQGDVRPLQGPGREWRLRVGDWRVRFAYDVDTHTIVVLRVLPRGRAHR
jgi:mRNA interferase RelE/StbE